MQPPTPSGPKPALPKRNLNPTAGDALTEPPAPVRSGASVERRARAGGVAGARILVVDDELDALELIRYNLETAGFQVAMASDGATAIDQARNLSPALIILDVMLPGLDGMEVCKILRRDPLTATIPIVMVTAKSGEIDRLLGLEFGADDYVTKPFSPRELLLRIKNILRRIERAQPKFEPLRCGDLVIDIAKHDVFHQGRRLALTATEFKLLMTLAERRGRVQTRDRLLRDVWNYDRNVDTRTVDTHMRRLRKKLGRAAKYLGTVRGIGYRFVPD